MAKNKRTDSSTTSISVPSTSMKSTPSRPDKAPAATEQDKIRWSFPTVSTCPRCRGSNTVATSTQGRVQYRRCRSAVCRERYTVIGTKIESKK